MQGKLRTALSLIGRPREFVRVLQERCRGAFYPLMNSVSSAWWFYLPRNLRVCRKYWFRLASQPDLNTPRKYTEKAQWRKLHAPQIELIARVTDKVEVLEYVRARIGGDHLLPVLWVCDSISADDVRALGDGVVVKPTHRSGQVAIIEHQDDVDAEAIAAHMSRCLRWPYSMQGEEPWHGWHKPRIFAQPLIYSPEGSRYIQDVKFHVFNQPEGPPRLVAEVINTTPHWRAIFNERYERLPFDWSPSQYPPPEVDPPKPNNFDEMLANAVILAREFDYVRVDFLLGAGNYYFSEMTFAPAGGFPCMEPSEWDEVVGSWWHLETGSRVDRFRWRYRAWRPLRKTENPLRLLLGLHRHWPDINVPGLRHSDYLKAASLDPTVSMNKPPRRGA